MDAGDRNRFYITTPIYYPNDRLHVGHTYTTVAADALARYHRLRGRETWFLTGTDEHGQNVERAAREAGKEPLEYIDPIVDWIKNLWSLLDIRYDDFIRTTEQRHKQRVQAVFQRLYDQGDIYKGVYRGLYCVRCEAYYTEDELTDGRRCPVHEQPAEWVEEESYFFRLSRYGDRLLEYIRRHPGFVQPASRRNEVIRFIEQGLEDLSVSRTSFRWGIPVPFDAKHVIYVWIDALTNYISALDYPDGEHYRRFWPADVHLIGKDILRFHAIIWPALLMALDVPLPRCVYGHGWLLIGGGKIGKSQAREQIIDPVSLVQKYGVDAVRYFLLREVPFGADGTYSEEALVRRTNADLANDLGNLVWRTISMIERFADGRVPAPTAGEDDGVLRETASQVFDAVERALENLELDEALRAAWELPKRANKYIDEHAPWDLNRRGQRTRLHTVLYNVAEAIRLCAVLLSPFLVRTPARIWQQLGMGVPDPGPDWNAARRWGGLRPGLQVRKGEPLFPRLDPDEVLAAPPGGAADQPAGGAPGDGGAASPGLSRAEAGDSAAPAPIDIETFRRLDLRVARIVAAERLAGTDRLLRLEVALGDERRQVVAGIAQHYDPDGLVGRQALLVANLAPVTIRGVRSEGMLLAADDGRGLALVGPLDEVADGSPVR